jgi:hypothetical protein
MTFSSFTWLGIHTNDKDLADWQVENGKAAFMEMLYAVYGRDSAEPGLQGTYTGLWEQFQQDLANEYRSQLIAAAHSTEAPTT